MRDRSGYQALWEWFGLSRASFLTLPRVLMHEMPDKWQADMARLLDEWDAAYPSGRPAETRVTAVENGKLAKMPAGACDYRRPNKHYIDQCRKPFSFKRDTASDADATPASSA